MGLYHDGTAAVYPPLLSCPGLLYAPGGGAVADSFALTAENDLTYPLLPSPQPQLTVGRDGATLWGPSTAMGQLRLAAGETVFVFRLRIGAAQGLWDGPMATLTGGAAPVTLSPQLYTSLLRTESQGDRALLLQRLLPPEPYQPLLRRSWALLEERRGGLRVAELCQAVGCGTRYLNRLYTQAVGLSAKECCELVRFLSSLPEILRPQRQSLLHVAVACGYFDQAHMNRQYKRFAGVTAREFREQVTAEKP